jgi:hypothetical protein
MMSAIDALGAWRPAIFRPLAFGRPALAASTIAVDGHSTRREIS